MASNNPHRFKPVLIVIIVIVLVIFGFIVSDRPVPVAPTHDDLIRTTSTSTLPVSHSHSTSHNMPSAPVTNTPALHVIATGLKIPWDLAFLPDGSYLVTERAGNLVRLEENGHKMSIPLPHPVPRGEGGLLGMTLHPDFAANNFIYLYMTTHNSTNGTKNAVFRYRYVDGKLTEEKTIINNIPGALYHDGGRIAFGPDRLLYITTGDAQTPGIAQDLKSLGGKILRLDADGGIPSDNPFGTAIYSYGHRNPQGLTWDNEGRLWSTEHGRSGLTSGMDEINLIVKGKNYGWPTIEGDAAKAGMENPALHSGARTTWAPASAVYHNGSLFFGGLLGESLYEATLEGDKVKGLKAHFAKSYGRIRTVRLGPDGMLYLTTSNHDGRGKPTTDDDRIIRVDPKRL